MINGFLDYIHTWAVSGSTLGVVSFVIGAADEDVEWRKEWDEAQRKEWENDIKRYVAEFEEYDTGWEREGSEEIADTASAIGHG